MRRAIDRVALVTAATTAGVAAVGTTGVVAYVVTSRADVIRDWLDTDPSVGIAGFAGAAAIVCLAGLALGHLASLPLRRLLERSATALAQLSDRFANGEARLEPLHSGIEQLDHVSDVISRRAQ